MLKWTLPVCIAAVMPICAQAQGTSLAFGDGNQDTSAPVEVTSEQLSVNQDDGTALFTGEVVVGQDDMRLYAPRVLVIYTENQDGIERMEATGGVTLIEGEDAAESERADYFPDDGVVIMKGDVLTTQGPNAVASDEMTVNLDDGTALATGRVRTLIQPSGGGDDG